tara:strand:- start:99 stop:299 length:201 start_codon:yes stop_codon:yes gene_type:complete
MPKTEDLKTKVDQLQKENTSLNHKTSRLQKALGAVRVEVGKIVVGREEVDNLRESIKRIDRIIDNV